MQNIVQLVDSYREKIFRDLKRLVDTNSFSTNADGLENIAEMLCDIAWSHGISFQKHYIPDTEGFPNLLYMSPHTSGYYVFVGHFDTVHEPTSDFNTLTDLGDTMLGPGINDMKAGLLVALYSLIILKELMPLETIPVRVLFNSDEEIGSPHSRKIIASSMKDAIGGFVFEAGKPPHNQIITGRKGNMELNIQVNGKASHAAAPPPRGVNAVVGAAKIITALDKLNCPDENTTIECTMIEGGIVQNVIPDRCCFYADIRVSNNDAIQKITQDIIKIINSYNKYGLNVTYTLVLRRPPLVKTKEAEKLIHRYFASCKKLNIETGEYYGGGASDSNLLAGHGIPCIDGLGAVGQYPHTEKEYIITETLPQRIAMFTHFFHTLITDTDRGVPL